MKLLGSLVTIASIIEECYGIKRIWVVMVEVKNCLIFVLQKCEENKQPLGGIAFEF